MKAEERKALRTNELEKGLKTALDAATHPPRTAVYWVVGIALAVAAVLLFYYLMTRADAAASARWVALDDAPLPEQVALLRAGRELNDTPQGRMLDFKEARLDLADGLRMLGLTPKPAIEKIQSAVERYEQLLKSAGRIPLLHQEALAGAAKGNEALGDLTKAKQWYTRLRDEYKDTPLGKDAEKQLERLETGRADLNALTKELNPESSARRN